MLKCLKWKSMKRGLLLFFFQEPGTKGQVLEDMRVLKNAEHFVGPFTAYRSMSPTDFGETTLCTSNPQMRSYLVAHKHKQVKGGHMWRGESWLQSAKQSKAWSTPSISSTTFTFPVKGGLLISLSGALQVWVLSSYFRCQVWWALGKPVGHEEDVPPRNLLKQGLLWTCLSLPRLGMGRCRFWGLGFFFPLLLYSKQKGIVEIFVFE